MILKNLKIFLFIICAQSANAMVVNSSLSKLVNTANQNSFANKVIVNSKLQIMRPAKKIADQIFNYSKSLAPNAIASLSNTFNNPYVLLIKSETLALTYIICINSCDHNKSIVQSLFAPQVIGKFIKDVAPLLIDGLVYASAEATYKNANSLVKQTVGPGAVALISLNFICPKCYKTALPETAKTLLTAVATSSALDFIQIKAEKTKQILNSAIKNPIVIGSVVVAGLLTCTYAYNSFDVENITSLVPTIMTMVEQTLFYNCAYKFSKNILNQIKTK